MQTYVEADYTPSERDVLARHFTTLVGPVAVLTGLPDGLPGAVDALRELRRPAGRSVPLLPRPGDHGRPPRPALHDGDGWPLRRLPRDQRARPRHASRANSQGRRRRAARRPGGSL